MTTPEVETYPTTALTNGTASWSISGPPANYAVVGTLAITDAPVGAFFTLSNGGTIAGTFFGPNPYGPVAQVAGQTISIAGSGLVAGETYTVSYVQTTIPAEELGTIYPTPAASYTQATLTGPVNLAPGGEVGITGTVDISGTVDATITGDVTLAPGTTVDVTGTVDITGPTVVETVNGSISFGATDTVPLCLRVTSSPISINPGATATVDFVGQYGTTLIDRLVIMLHCPNNDGQNLGLTLYAAPLVLDDIGQAGFLLGENIWSLDAPTAYDSYAYYQAVYDVPIVEPIWTGGHLTINITNNGATAITNEAFTLTAYGHLATSTTQVSGGSALAAAFPSNIFTAARDGYNTSIFTPPSGTPFSTDAKTLGGKYQDLVVCFSYVTSGSDWMAGGPIPTTILQGVEVFNLTNIPGGWAVFGINGISGNAPPTPQASVLMTFTPPSGVGALHLDEAFFYQAGSFSNVSNQQIDCPTGLVTPALVFFYGVTDTNVASGTSYTGALTQTSGMGTFHTGGTGTPYIVAGIVPGSQGANGYGTRWTFTTPPSMFALGGNVLVWALVIPVY